MNLPAQNRENARCRHARYAAVRAVARRVRRAAMLLAACSLLAGQLPLNGDPSEGTSGYPVKLGFLYQFALFVQWPADSFNSATAPLVVCVVGQDPFDAELEEQFEGRTVEKHHMLIRRAKNTDDLKACHMVFVPAPESRQTAKVIASLQGTTVLTVGETEGFAERGGIINFTIYENRLHFEINLDAVRQTRLTISSRVLALARIVRDPPHP